MGFALLTYFPMFEHSTFKTGAFLVLLSGVLLLPFTGAYAEDDVSISTEATSVLLSRTKELLKRGTPEELIPYLDEILIRVRGATDKSSLKIKSFCMYQVGASLMQMGQYPDVIEALMDFLEEFPSDSKSPQAALMIAEAYAVSGDWAGAEQYASKMLEAKSMDAARRMTALQLLAESLYRQEKWEEATVSLKEIFKETKDKKVRTNTSVMLATCYAKAKDFDNFMKFLSYCDDSVRQNAGLNIALIEMADQKMQEGDYLNALVLYRNVLQGEERKTLYEKQIKELEQFLATPYVARVGTSRSAFDKVHNTKEIEFKSKKAELVKINEGKSYDTDLALRMGSSYIGLKRSWPGYTQFKRIYTESPTHPMAEDARFQAFTVMLGIPKWDEAIREGSIYLETYPTGKFAPEVSLNQMQVFLRIKQFDQAQAVGLKALEDMPDHRFIDQVTYLLGYIAFQKIEYQEALTYFQKVFEVWPDSFYHESADYWISMSYLFLGQFEQAVLSFETYLNNTAYSPLNFAEDATYRLGISLYGAGRFEEAERIFRSFLVEYPGSDLLSEAYSMVGDLRGAEGDLEIALEHYELALGVAVSIDQINYATFQMAKTYELDDRYDEIITLMEVYLDQHGDEGNFSGAGFWIGKSYKAQGQGERAFSTYLKVIVDYGNKLENEDVDLILRELIKENDEGENKDYRALVNSRLRHELESARGQKQEVLVLRLKTLFAYISVGPIRDQFVAEILSDGKLDNSGPLTLLLIAAEAAAKGDGALVHKTYKHCMEEYADSEILVDVMNIELQMLLDEGEYQQVIDLAEEITNRFGYREEVGESRKLKADAYRMTQEYELAIKTYKEIFAIREWRGPLTPQALYWIGVCTYEQGKLIEASAYFQRVYVMYAGYAEWAAKAYAGSIVCLEKLGRKDEVIRTYQEMLSNPEIAMTPEGLLAQKRLNQLLPEGNSK